jgi:D-beta-D-heptose 7-phosphate kinase / D-beta-D-heptose 1-phosphate adenosyltransferase
MSRPQRRHVVVVGDLLLDRDLVGTTERVCPDAPVPVVDVGGVSEGPGGAGLTALLCRAEDVAVTLVAPVADDAGGERLLALLRDGGVEVIALGHEGATRCKTRVRAGGQTVVRLDEGGPGSPVGPLPVSAVEAVREADAVLVSDYGAGLSDHDGLRGALVARIGRQRGPAGHTVWDPHPRGGAPVPGCTLVTPNLAEALAATGQPAGTTPDLVALALHERWGAVATCVTAGPSGAWLADGAGNVSCVPAGHAERGDPCGAGDRFAAASAVALAHGLLVSEAVGVAVHAATRWVRDGGAAGFRDGLHGVPGREAPEEEDARGDGGQDVATRTRAAGGVLVATGGCFDVLHAGHVSCLEAARGLGDALVVLLNSDESVRRLKGPGRPVQSQADRARVLRGLSCVDDVVVFDEDDPRKALSRLRPDVWAKGGDYNDSELREAGLVRSWGGRVVLLPYLAGRSTTAILQDAR